MLSAAGWVRVAVAPQPKQLLPGLYACCTETSSPDGGIPAITDGCSALLHGFTSAPWLFSHFHFRVSDMPPEPAPPLALLPTAMQRSCAAASQALQAADATARLAARLAQRAIMTRQAKPVPYCTLASSRGPLSCCAPL